MSSKPIGELTLTDRLLLGRDAYHILALHRHGLDDERVTVTIWTGSISHAREHTFTLTDVVEVAPPAESEASDGNG